MELLPPWWLITNSNPLSTPSEIEQGALINKVDSISGRIVLCPKLS
jgi:hypothetical protein